MNGMKAEAFNPDYMFVKAETCGFDKDMVITGYYHCNHDPDNINNYISYVNPIGEEQFYEVSPYTVCRNTGIKDINGSWTFEYDLLKLFRNGENVGYGFFVWDEIWREWRIRKSTEYSGSYSAHYFQFETIGNIILSDEDAEKIYRQDKEINEREAIIDRQECRSTQHINRKNKEFLPR